MKLYDLLVIGGGFSSITFVSNLLKRGIKPKLQFRSRKKTLADVAGN